MEEEQVTKVYTDEYKDAATAKRDEAEKFIRTARQRFKLAWEDQTLQRSRSIEEIDFNSGQHWIKDDRDARIGQGKVVLEVNRTPQYLNQVANEQRMTRPQILIRPTGNGADVKTAEVKQGIISSVERRSGAEGIRDDAFYRLLEKGWAYWRVIEEFENERSFKRTIRTAPIHNDFSVYFDPMAQEYDKSDARYCFITEDVPTEEYKLDYPDSEINSWNDYSALGDEQKYWIGDGVIRVVEYYYKIRTAMLLYAMPGGQNKFADELTAEDKVRCLRDETGEPITRMSSKQFVYWAKITPTEIVEGNKDKTAGRRILGKFIPVIPVLGRRIRVENRYIYTGMVRDAMQPCLAADYWLSAITEMVALAPKAPYKAVYKAISNYLDQWETLNTENWSVLFWDNVDENGQPLPEPKREYATVDIQAMTFILKYADEDLKKVMGIYNAALGAPGPETSGVAIGARQRESDVANYNYIDNLKRSIAYEARVYLSLIAEVYDQEQVAQMVRPNGSTDTAIINKMFQGPDGTPIIHDMTDENYDADVQVGASFNTKREQAAAGMIEYLKVDPGAAPLVGDLIADNQDFPNKEEFKERLKTRAEQVAPGIVKKDGDQEEKIPPKFMAQYQEQAKMLEHIQAQNQQMQQIISQKQLEFQHDLAMESMKLASEERRAAMVAETATLQMASKADLAMLDQAFKKLELDIAQFQKPGPVEQQVGA